MKYLNAFLIGVVLFGLLSLKGRGVGEPLTGIISDEGYTCNANLKYPILETDKYYLTINDHMASFNSKGKLKVNVFDKNLKHIQVFTLADLYVLREKLSHDILESLFLDANGEPCVLYSRIDKNKDKLSIHKARINLTNEKLVDVSPVMEIDIPKVSMMASVFISHIGIGSSHYIGVSYFKSKEVERYEGYFNANFEPEKEHTKKGPKVTYGANDISGLGSTWIRPNRKRSHVSIGSSNYIFEFDSDESKHKVDVLEGPDLSLMVLPDNGDEKSVTSIVLGKEYTDVKSYYSEEESIITFFAFKYSSDEKGSYSTIEGFKTCRLDAVDFHLIDETEYDFSDENRSIILTDIDESGKGGISEKELKKGIKTSEFSARLEFFSSQRFIVILQNKVKVSSANAVGQSTHLQFLGYKYGDFAYLGYSGNGRIDFVNRVHVGYHVFGESVSSGQNTYKYNSELYFLYKNDDHLKYQKIKSDGSLTDLEVDKEFVKNVEGLTFDFTNIHLQPGTFILSANNDRKFHLVRMTLPE